MKLFAALIALLLLVLSWTGSQESAVEGAAVPPGQPVAFDHALHAEEGLGCADCHAGAENGPHAQLPSIGTCLLCHEELQGEDPEEAKVLAYAEDPGWIPWREVNRYAGHVYFSHEAHVTFAEMDCSDCHGDVEAMTEPFTESQLGPLTMKWCMDCHTEQQVTNDCLACHK